MKNSLIETLAGLFIVLVAAMFVIFSYMSTGEKTSGDGVIYKASFDSIDGIAVNSDVKIGGVAVGKVTRIEFDETYQVLVTLKVKKEINIPNDSSLEVVSSGLIGEKYLAVALGTSDLCLKNEEEFLYTKSSTNLEDFLNKVVASFLSKDKKADS